MVLGHPQNQELERQGSGQAQSIQAIERRESPKNCNGKDNQEFKLQKRT